MAIRPASDTFYTARQNTAPEKTQTASDKQVFLANVSQQQQPTARERVDSARDRLSSLTREYGEKQHLGERSLKPLKDRLEVLHQDVAKLKREVADRQLGRELTALQGNLNHLRFTVDRDRVQLLDTRLRYLSEELTFRGTGKTQFVKDRLEPLRKDVDKLKEELGGGGLGRQLTDIRVGISALEHLADDQTVMDDVDRGGQMLTRLSADVADHLRNVAKDPTKAASPDDFNASFKELRKWIAQFEKRIASNITTKFNNERAAQTVSREVARPFYEGLHELQIQITNHSKKK